MEKGKLTERCLKNLIYIYVYSAIPSPYSRFAEQIKLLQK